MAEDLQGLAETEKALDKLARRSTKAKKIAVLEGGKIFAEGLERNTPPGRNSKHNPHMKDNVVYSKPREDGEVYVSVGYSKETASRMHFSNFGTIKQPPQHYMERTENQYAQEVMNVIAQIYSREMGL
ncbi:HK97-gp10 family putative phage morphogenesis protein [Bacillus halotolerans]|uniref:HK97-gp10 family putative phage morphogenesis protein n=1 Tax=Bacillus halotolerans TaxID=260554 RepID=UPI002DBFDB7C|nr:HK97-gp10 family putative phage morphogenesis protein [Bacillus halotolerans]MEC1663350.1 HK97 gp10 family phage protein [Bacillus halotolerans]